MDLDEFQRRCKQTDDPKQPVEYYTHAIMEEVGELMREWKEFIRKNTREKHKLTDEEYKRIRMEIFDIMWDLSMFADRLNIKIDNVAHDGLAKLKSREDKGTVHERSTRYE